MGVKEDLEGVLTEDERLLFCILFTERQGIETAARVLDLSVGEVRRQSKVIRQKVVEWNAQRQKGSFAA